MTFDQHSKLERFYLTKINPTLTLTTNQTPYDAITNTGSLVECKLRLKENLKYINVKEVGPILELDKVRTISNYIRTNNIAYDQIYYISIFLDNLDYNQTDITTINFNITELIKIYQNTGVLNQSWLTEMLLIDDTATDGNNKKIKKDVIRLIKLEKIEIVSHRWLNISF